MFIIDLWLEQMNRPYILRYLLGRYITSQINSSKKLVTVVSYVLFDFFCQLINTKTLFRYPLILHNLNQANTKRREWGMCASFNFELSCESWKFSLNHQSFFKIFFATYIEQYRWFLDKAWYDVENSIFTPLHDGKKTVIVVK